MYSDITIIKIVKFNGCKVAKLCNILIQNLTSIPKKGDNLVRKLISSVLILVIFITSFTVSFANKPLNKVLLKENGRGRNYQIVNLKIDGKTVESKDVPPIIYPLNGEGRTLVPLRMIIEHLEDKLNANIEWDGAKWEVKIKTKEKEIVLKIDSPDAIVNGVKKRLPDDIPAKLLAIGDNGRTMVPIRFFAEEFGIDIDWDPVSITASLKTPEKPEKKPNPKPSIPQEDINTADVMDVRVKMNGSVPQIRIKTSEKIDYKELKLREPERLVIDLNNAKFNLRNKNRLEANGILDIKTGSEAVKRIRASQFQMPTEEKPDDLFITRVVVELGNLTDYEIDFDDKTGEFVVDFTNYIYNVKKENINIKEVVVIEGNIVDDYSIIRLNNPERIAVDIKGAVLHNRIKNRTINVDGRVVKSIRTCQHESGSEISDGKTVRIVIDLCEDIDHEEAYIEVKDNKLKVHVEGKPFKAMQYEETGWTTSKFMLKGSRVTRYSIERRLVPNIIDITVPKTDIDLELMDLDIDDHIIKTINIDEDRDNYNIQLELQDSVENKLLSSERGRDLILELNNKDAKYREILVVIDPGHGGPDPGTVSPILNMKESEVVLDISIKLNWLLTEAGFRTYVTRMDNLSNNFKLSLHDRVDAANVLDADLFVSVHANSFTNNLIDGIETFYRPNDASSKRFAEMLQYGMVNDLNMTDRGAKPANYYVLVHTTMPAALVETGFMSNPSDEAKLATDKYREQVAESIFKSIVKYLEETK